jgi:streptomycin 6-kinase
MLSRDDEDIVQRDKRLPSLALVLDPEAFLRTLQSSMPEVELSEARPMYVRYKPGMNCLASFRVKANGREIDVYAKVHRADDLVKLEKARIRSITTSVLGAGRIVLNSSSIVVSIFPNDSKLKSLRAFGNDGKRKRLMQTLFHGNSEFENGSAVRLQYKPERRYVAQWNVDHEPKAVLKFYTGHGYKTIQRNTSSLASRGALRVARQLGNADDQYVLAFEWLEGRLLRDVLTSENTNVSDIELVGAALAELHAQCPKALVPVSRAEEATALVAIADAMSFLCPQHSSRTSRVARRIAAKLLSESPVRRPIHGDFYDKQVLLNDDGVGILDFDEAVCGDPASDLGNFVAHLERLALRGSLAQSCIEPICDAFFEGSQRATGCKIPSHTDLHIAARLFLLLPHPFRHREAEWLTQTEAILDRVEELFDASHVATQEIHSLSFESSR